MSTDLWNSKYSKLVLKGWNKQEDEELYSFGTIHTFVLDGSVQIYNSKNEKHSLLLLPLAHHESKYNQQYKFSTFQKTTTLQLIHTDFNN